MGTSYVRNSLLTLSERLPAPDLEAFKTLIKAGNEKSRGEREGKIEGPPRLSPPTHFGNPFLPGVLGFGQFCFLCCLLLLPVLVHLITVRASFHDSPGGLLE